jgi:hypothetical protein
MEEDDERKRLEAEFARLSRELDSPEGVAQTDARVRKALESEMREHELFLAQSREVANKRTVR